MQYNIKSHDGITFAKDVNFELLPKSIFDKLKTTYLEQHKMSHV